MAVAGPHNGTVDPGVGASSITRPARVALTEVAVESLAGQSLLVAAPEVDRAARLRMLETVREYAGEQLDASGEAEAIRARHPAYFLQLAERAEAASIGPDQKDWLRRLVGEHDNLRAALQWSIGRRDADTALRLGAALRWFWVAHGHLSEGENWVGGALACTGGAPPAPRANALNAAGNLALARGDSDKAGQLFEESLALRRGLGDALGTAATLYNLGLVAAEQGDLVMARERFEECLRLNMNIDDQWGVAMARHTLAALAREHGDYEQAAALGTQALRAFEDLADTGGICLSLINLGSVARDQGTLERATSLYDRSLTLYRGLGDRRGVGFALLNLASVAYRQSALGRAEALTRESLAEFRELGLRRHTAPALELLATVAAERGEATRAAHLFGAAEALRQVIHSPLPPADRARCDRAVATARAEADAQVFEHAWRSGAEAPADHAVEYALCTSVGTRMPD